MTKSTITREQAQKIIVAADEVITALAGNNEDVHPDDSKKMCDLWDDLNDRYAPPEVVRELARMALAAMDSEPVAYISKADFDAGYPHILARRDFNKACTMPVYAAPQPAPVVPVVPKEWTIADAVKFCNETGRQDAGSVMDAWNACRSAMLQAEHVTTANKLGNSPVIPDTWIPVSERMPEDEQEVLTRNRMGHRFVSFFDKHSGLFFDRLDAPAACCIEHVLVTHWMPLPAASQEVGDA